MKYIIDKIKKDLLLHPKVSQSILSNSPVWKRAHYIFLSELIEDELSKSVYMTPKKKIEMGTTISYSTIHRIFSATTDEKFTDDLRFIKTLDKFCIFLGYPSLNDFLHKKIGDSKTTELKNDEKPIENETGLSSDYFFTIIKQYCCEEFEYLKNLTINDVSSLKKYCFEEGPFINRITQNYDKLSNLGYSLSQEDNRSNYELYNFKALVLEKEFVVISVKEFWNLYFINSYGKKPKHLSNFNNTQKYFLKKINNEWKIWDNYNPYSPDFLKKIEKFSKEKKN
ncbi:MAG: hypothetical protein ABI426_06670 [Flavobacterium sp.]